MKREREWVGTIFEESFPKLVNDSNHIWKWLCETHDGQIQVNMARCTIINLLKIGEKIKMLKAAKG